jgi:beta-alanine--pyruvate transaminase
MPSGPEGQNTARLFGIPNDLESFWVPFTPNRAFKRAPRLIARAKGMYYFTPQDRPVLDGTAGLWCTNAGHNRDPIVAAIAQQAETLDYAPAFQFAHSESFELASRVAALAPAGLDRVFFCNSGSEAVDTALKIALAYQNVRGEAARTRLIGRERGYHGVGFGGISVGGIVNNRKHFGSLLAGVDHLPPIAASTRPSPRVSPNGARIWPTIWNGSSRSMTHPPSLPSSSSRWRARPGCCRRQKVICKNYARFATAMGFC